MLIDKIEKVLELRSEKVHMSLAPYSSCAKIYLEEDAEANGEAPYQLIEGADYEYQLSEGFRFEEVNGIVFPSKYHSNSGHIKTGNYVGTLSLEIVDTGSDSVVGTYQLEIRSVKASYRRDYRIMMEDITSYYTELVMQSGSPVTQNFEVADNTDPVTAYQRFAFVQSIVESESFADALHQIQITPLKKWKDTDKTCSISRVRRIDRRIVRQITGSPDRVMLSGDNTLSRYMNSAPRHVIVTSREETLDIPENQFVKHVLKTLHSFCLSINRMTQASDRLKKESRLVCEKLEEYLNLPVLRNLSNLTYLPLNSPALQKKEGYREVLQAWLMFDLAAVLTWSGGNDVYQAGAKNVAALYEYWLFFVLLETVSSIFNIPAKEKSKLICIDDEKLDLSLKQGKFCMVKGRSVIQNRVLNVRLSYNRSFMPGRPLRYQGSWTKAMRPDYTLSIWPGDINMAEAERDNLIAHMHFDAKYRLDKILLGESKETDYQKRMVILREEKEEAEQGIYKRIDLLKMHAYKDAIRRTVGAYILYPGSSKELLRGYHEIIPGLGAFAISPSDKSAGVMSISRFINDVIVHFLNRTSQREKISYYQYEVYKNEDPQKLKHPFTKEVPESVKEYRGFMPDETTVLVVNIPSLAVFKWMCERHLFALNLGTDSSALDMDKYVNAHYLLLHDENNVLGLVSVKRLGASGIQRKVPSVCSRTTLLNKGYPSGTGNVDPNRDDVYLVFDIDPNMGCEKELESHVWDLNDIFPNSYMATMSFPISLVDLINKSRQ